MRWRQCRIVYNILRSHVLLCISLCGEFSLELSHIRVFMSHLLYAKLFAWDHTRWYNDDYINILKRKSTPHIKFTVYHMHYYMVTYFQWSQASYIATLQQQRVILYLTFCWLVSFQNRFHFVQKRENTNHDTPDQSQGMPTYVELTHWGRGRIAAIFQTEFSFKYVFLKKNMNFD